MNTFNVILDFLASVALATMSQLVWLLGFIFVFGLLLYFLSRFTRITYVKSAGVKLDIIFTGWIGTPVHEMGHAIFCVLFRHRIVAMKLYNPDPADGALGYVSHTFDERSRYQKIGNFFIGIGPILFGSLVLYALLYFLLPHLSLLVLQAQQQGTHMAHDMRGGSWLSAWQVAYSSAAGIFKGVFSAENFSSWRFWLFLYLSFCIASHMTLSPPDIKGAKNGLITVVVTLLICNLIILGIEALGFHSYAGSYWQYVKLDTYSVYINSFLGALGALLTYALIISGVNFVVSYIGLSIYNLVKGRGFINPFWI